MPTDPPQQNAQSTAHRADPAMCAVIDTRVVSESLPGQCYVEQKWFDVDLDEIFAKQWLFVAAEAEIAEPGDYVTVEFGTRSVIVTRDNLGNVRAHHNVCRHRGARLITQANG